MNARIYLIIGLIGVFASQGCAQNEPMNKNYHETTLERYGSGAAEIAIYDLEQNRYDAVHKGGTIMSIWVTEDFLVDKQVKDEGISKGKSTTILKNIQRRNFTTGLYDYSMMTTTFTPIDRKEYPHTLKTTLSSQDWCGHSFSQINKNGKQYKNKLLSYFESEGDTEKNYALALMEDEIFNLIRMDAGLLPQGATKIIPSAVFARLMHIEQKPYSANITLSDYKGSDFSGNDLVVCSVSFSDMSRQLDIVFDKSNANAIVGWTDSYPSIFDRQTRTTKATLRKTEKIDYWNKHSPADVSMRAEWGLK